MRKTIPFILIALFLFKNIRAQQPTFTIGEPNSTFDFIPMEILGESESEYIVLSFVFGLTLSAAISGEVSSIEDLKVAYMDKNSLNKTKLLSFPEFQGEDVTRTGKTVLEGSELKGDTLNIFTCTWDKDQKDYTIHVWSLNSSTLEPYTPKAKLLARIEDNGRSDMKRAEIKYLSFMKQFAIIYAEYSKKTKVTKIHVIRLDNSLKPIDHQELALEGTKHGAGIKDIEADASGNIYFINAVSDKAFPDYDDERWIQVHMIPVGGGAITSSEIELVGGNAINGVVSVGPKGEVYVCGYYSLMVDPKEGAKEFYGGSYIAQISPQTGDVLKVDEMELTENQKKALYTRSMKPNSVRAYYTEMNNMRPKSVYIDDMGNTTLVGSVQYTIHHSGSRSSYYSYHSNSMMVSKFSSACEVKWQMVVPRSAFINSLKYSLYPLVYSNMGNTYIIFNDDHKNMEVLAQIASGKKASSKSSSSSSKPSKPKDYPPTDSDEIAEMDYWNFERTALRYTTIDPNGMWKVNWLSVEGAEEKDKIPAIEGSIKYFNSEGYLISNVYTKYGKLGLKKSALAKIKI